MREGSLSNVIEFESLIGGQDGNTGELVAKGNPFHLKVKRHGGSYSLTVRRANSKGDKPALVHFWLTRAQLEKIYGLSETP